MANHERLPGLLWKVNQNAIGTPSDAIRALLDAMRALQGFFPHRGFHIFPQTSNLLCFCLGTLRFFAERRFPSCFFEDPGAEMDPTIAGRKSTFFNKDQRDPRESKKFQDFGNSSGESHLAS